MEQNLGPCFGRRRTKGLLEAAILVLPIAFGVASSRDSAAATNIGGQARIEAAFLEHPEGFADEEETTLFIPSLRLSWAPAGAGTTWRVLYEGAWQSPRGASPLESQDHAVSLEWTGEEGEKRTGPSVGLRARTHTYQGDYEAYRFRTVDGYLSWKARPDAASLLRATAELQSRQYAERPEESSVIATARTELQRFRESGTTLGVVAEAGYKAHPDPVARVVWNEAGTPSAARWRMRLSAAQSLGSRAGLRLAVESRSVIDPIPFVSQDGLVGTPLMDEFAAGGRSVASVLKLHLPRDVWVEVGGGVARWDYGELRFTTTDAFQPGARVDEEVFGFLAADRSFAERGGRPIHVGVQLRWDGRDSSVPAYAYRGLGLTTTLSWDF